MAGRKKKPAQLAFANKLVLNQWLVSLFGHDPLAEARKGKKILLPLERLKEILDNANLAGADQNNRHKFAERLRLELDPSAAIKPQDLTRYEDNISSHTQALNARRERQVVWKYYQWLSLLFSEVYLDRYFTDVNRLRDDLNGYLKTFNAFWADQGIETGLSPYTLNDLSKVCLQNATGSGKTLLMHIQIRQFALYAKAHGRSHGFNRTILLTPNEDLSAQHAREMRASALRAQRLKLEQGDLFSHTKASLTNVDYTEITKLADEDGEKGMAVRNLGPDNLLLIDEAHRGMGSEAGAWFRRRNELCSSGFAFEYSATFREASKAAKNPILEAAYAKSVLFDYSYRHFYADGYGKDYRIFNLPEKDTDAKFPYLCASLLTFYQQLRLYEDQGAAYAPFNIEKPLWVFVGTSVTGGKLTKEQERTTSDLVQILKFFADFLGDPARARAEIKSHLSAEGDFADAHGAGAFAGAFAYLNFLVGQKGETIDRVFTDICGRLFQSKAGGELKLRRVKGDDTEIILRVGQSDRDFGLINVGDAAGLAKVIAEAELKNLSIEDSNFSAPLFASVSASTSPINLLIGSKKFVEGWDCWRVSTLGLMNVGKSEGAQIIQLFGRGVRLKGYDWSLQRSNHAPLTDRPPYMGHVETLNVFGVAATYMANFRKFLEEEGLPLNDDKKVIEIPLNKTYDFGQRLMILRPKRKKESGEDYDFKRDGAVPTLGQSCLRKLVSLDCYSDIEAIRSEGPQQSAATKHSDRFKKAHLALLDYQALYFDVEQHKRERGWHNINIPPGAIEVLLEDPGWYEILAPSSHLSFTSGMQIPRWQAMASALLRLYLDRLYAERKAAFTESRLEYRVLDREDPNLPKEEAYQLIVNSNEKVLISHIEGLQRAMAAQVKGLQTSGNLKGINLSNHLYKPLLHATKGTPIQFKPAALNESEFQFVKDLSDHLDRLAKSPLEGDVFLLRNESRGKGMGFFEAGNFYPDFLLWLVQGDRQHLAFIEPHGLQHESRGSPKVEFHKVIKEIEARLADPKISLSSFILSPTNTMALQDWKLSKEEFHDQNVYFLNEDQETYVAKILEKMAAA